MSELTFMSQKPPKYVQTMNTKKSKWETLKGKWRRSTKSTTSYWSAHRADPEWDDLSELTVASQKRANNRYAPSMGTIRNHLKRVKGKFSRSKTRADGAA
jgi:hypothetical protein